ncbi:MAG: hypothetical protein WKI04_03710 [Ferruginibacter sp.]
MNSFKRSGVVTPGLMPVLSYPGLPVFVSKNKVMRMGGKRNIQVK